MKRTIKPFLIVAGVVSLSGCVTDQKFKVRFEPLMPIPYLIVPDEGDKDNPNPNDQNYPPQQYTPPPPRYKDYRYKSDDYQDYRYEEN